MQIEKRPPKTEPSPFVQLVGGLKCLAGRFDVHEGNGDGRGRLSRPIFTRQRLNALHWAVPVGRKIRLAKKELEGRLSGQGRRGGLIETLWPYTFQNLTVKSYPIIITTRLASVTLPTIVALFSSFSAVFCSSVCHYRKFDLPKIYFILKHRKNAAHILILYDVRKVFFQCI